MSADYYRMPEENVADLISRIEKLRKKAEKLGLAPPLITEVAYEDVPLTTASNAGYHRYVILSLSGEAPVISGWSLISKIEHAGGEVGNVIRSVPGQSCPIEYRQAEPNCDHCHTSRRRSNTYILGDRLGIYRQIGRNCLADYLRNPRAAENLCVYAEIAEAAQDCCSGAEVDTSGRISHRASTEHVLALTARLIRSYGWTSKSRSVDTGDPSTASLVSRMVFDPKYISQFPDLEEIAKSISDSDRDLARAATEWIKSKRADVDTLSDYMYNLLVIASESTVLERHLGLLCSLIATYQWKQGISVDHQRQAQSEHIGTVGKRETWSAKYLDVREFDGGRWSSVKYMYRFAVADRDILIWWTTSELRDLTAGDAVEITGTVKKHAEYRGVKQTEISRCKVKISCQNPV